jgi:hypothetical protein
MQLLSGACRFAFALRSLVRPLVVDGPFMAYAVAVSIVDMHVDILHSCNCERTILLLIRANPFTHWPYRVWYLDLRRCPLFVLRALFARHDKLYHTDFVLFPRTTVVCPAMDRVYKAASPSETYPGSLLGLRHTALEGSPCSER